MVGVREGVGWIGLVMWGPGGNTGWVMQTNFEFQVAVRHAKVRGRGQYQAIGPRTRLEIAYSVDVGMRSLGRKAEMHHSSIMRNQLAVANTFVEHQNNYMASLVLMCRQFKPLVVATSRKWDETKQSQIRLRTVEGAQRAAEQDLCCVYLYVFI